MNEEARKSNPSMLKVANSDLLTLSFSLRSSITAAMMSHAKPNRQKSTLPGVMPSSYRRAPKGLVP